MYQKKERLKIFKSLSQPILVIDTHYKIIDANLAAAAWIDLDYDNLIGQMCYELAGHETTPCWEKEQVGCPVKMAQENSNPVRIIHENKFCSRPIIEEVVATPIFNAAGAVDYIIEELRDITELLNAKEVVTHLKKELNTLRGIIPICASCKKIRDDNGFWQNVEHYISSRSDAQFSHSMCPECMQTKHPEICEMDPKLCQDEIS